MQISRREARQILLFSLVLMIVPIVVFPARFGTDLARASLVNALYELLFYGTAIYLSSKRSSLIQIVQAAGICLVYRLALGALFGILVAAAYSMNLSVSLSLGMSSYLPVIILHIAATPFILRPVISQVYEPSTQSRRYRPDYSPSDSAGAGTTTLAVSRSTGFMQQVPEQMIEARESAPTREIAPVPTIGADANGFDRATHYISESGSVVLAAVIDAEGLLLSHCERGEIVAEDWAPLALVLQQSNEDILRRTGWGRPDKLDLTVGDKRVVIACDGEINLMIVAEHHSDNLLSIRVSQGLEMIRKYMTEKYEEKSTVNSEKSYVSSTE